MALTEFTADVIIMPVVLTVSCDAARLATSLFPIRHEFTANVRIALLV